MTTPIDLNPIIIETQKNTTPAYSIIWLHRLGAYAHDFKNIPSELKLSSDLNIRFIFPNAPIRPITINGGFPMRGWYDIKSLTDLNHEDEEGILASYKLIGNLINEQINLGIESKNIFLAGFSQGAAMSLFTGLRFEKPLGGIISLSGYLPLQNNLKTEASAQNKNIPIFMAHGTYDTVVPLMLPQHSKNFLESLGYQVDWHTYEIDHSLCTQEILNVSQWLNKVMFVLIKY